MLQRVTLAILLGCAPLAAQEAGSARVVPIQVTGDPATRFSLVVLGDGYTAAELPKFREHVEKHLNILWSLEPFRSYRNYINVYAVEIVSGESGITCDPAHRQPRKTPLSLQFQGGCQNPNARGVVFDRASNEEARRYARMATPHYDQILAIANTDTYGGIGGREATTTGGNALSPYITPHEIGHSLGRLQDEYTYRERGVKGPIYSQAEPASHHHTLLTEAEMRAQQKKWYRWLGEPSESGGTIGRYEGGMYSVGGLFRPSKHSLMISLGYYFDQVSLERLTERISGQVELISASTDAARPVAANEVIWIETAHPNYHELDVIWDADGRVLASERGKRALDTRAHNLRAGQKVTVKVVDPTSFVRDPLIRDTSFSATRSWTLGGEQLKAANVSAPILGSTATARPVAGSEVVYVEVANAGTRELPVSWRLDDRAVRPTPNSRSIRLAEQRLSAGTHKLSATVEGQTLNWTIDNTMPTVNYTLATPVATLDRANGKHFFMRDQFTMKLEPRDDQPGYVVAEFRVNGDGWHHYYGWPDAPPGTPFLFTPRGTTIKELVYGSLSSEGLSPQPWETRAPGWGTHRIEYRARDAAGNIGPVNEFTVTFAPTLECTKTISANQAALDVPNGVTCVNGATITGDVTVAPGASLVASKATFKGNVSATNANTVELIGSTVEGVLRASGTTGQFTVFGGTLKHQPVLSNNARQAVVR